MAVFVAIALYGLLPESLLLGPRFPSRSLELVLLVAVLMTNPRRLTRENRLSRALSLSVTALIIVSNLVALGLLVHNDRLARGGRGAAAGGASSLGHKRHRLRPDVSGTWIVVGRSRGRWPAQKLPFADFRFRQDEDDDNVARGVSQGSSLKSDWTPTFMDYLYVSTTNWSAFSPTDTMPLPDRAKV